MKKSKNIRSLSDEYYNFSRRLMTACRRAVKNGQRVIPRTMRRDNNDCCPLGAMMGSGYPTIFHHKLDILGLENLKFDFRSFYISFDQGFKNETPESKMGLKFRKLALEDGFK